MKVIRRTRKVTIQQCAFGQWKQGGSEGTFNCPNCGITYGAVPELDRGDQTSPIRIGEEGDHVPRTQLPVLGSIEPGEATVKLLPASSEAGSQCGGGCAGNCGGRK